MATPRKWADRRESNIEHARLRRERERQEYEAGLALARRNLAKPLPMSDHTADCIALYRTEKAKRLEAGAKLDGTSGRHPVVHAANNATRGLLRVAL